ncbi:MAG: acetoin utilization protein AcuC, partial [Candidatus Puniceispirillaceae bacterium]
MFCILGSDIFRGSVYGKGHPLNIARVWPVIDICLALDWIESGEYCSIEPAQPEDLRLFHTADYIQALQEAEKYQKLGEQKMQRHRIGLDNNPIFPQIYRRPATAAAASIFGAKLLLSGDRQTVFNPSGGTHHGMPDKANGFCFVNDPALAILTLLEGGAGRVAYIDIDAHHADGVEAHLSSDPRIKLWSVHEENRWPRTGLAGDKGGGQACNFPLARGAGNTALLEILDQHILPDIQQFSPEFIVLQAGCDGLMDDPQSGLAYT